MQKAIACEGFDLTPAIKEHVEQNIDIIKENLPTQGTVRVFLSNPSQRNFTALFKVHIKQRDVVATETEDNLYKAITGARVHLERRLRDLREKRISRRRGHRIEPQ